METSDDVSCPSAGLKAPNQSVELTIYMFFICFASVCIFQVSDTGQYVCMATNVAGQVDKHFHLNIYGSLA